MKADEVVTAVRRHFGAETDDMGPEWAALHEFNIQGLSGSRCDLFLYRAWQGRPKGHERIAVEVKVARGDLLDELRKPYKRAPFMAVAHRFYFACPPGLMAPEEVPEDCGLLEVSGRGCRQVVAAPRHAPEPMPERAMVEAFRRAARAEARIRTADRQTDPAGRIVALEAAVTSAEAATRTARDAEDRARRRSERHLALLMRLVPADTPIPCVCHGGPIHRHGIHWRHHADSPRGDRCKYPWPDGERLAVLLEADPPAPVAAGTGLPIMPAGA